MWRYAILLALPGIIASPLKAKTADHPSMFDAELISEIDTKGAVDLEMVLTNRMKGNVCFFLYGTDARLLSARGTDVPSHVMIADTVGKLANIQVVWNDGEKYPFRPLMGGIGQPFQTIDEARKVAKITFRLNAYDCATLFRHPYGKAPLLFTRELTSVPTFLP